MQLRHSVLDSPVGPLTVVLDDDGALAGLYYLPGHVPSPRASALGHPAPPDDPAVQRAAAAVGAYLAGEVDAVDLPISPAAGTPFQLAVWEQIAAVPRGAVMTYGEIAAAVGRPTAVRAVGQAVGRNPVSLAVPCHRVVGHGGRVTGYAGGVERKRWLLALEAGQPLPDLPPDLLGPQPAAAP